MPQKVWRALWMSNYSDQAFNGLHFFVVTCNVLLFSLLSILLRCVSITLNRNEKLHKRWKIVFILCSDKSWFFYFIVGGVNSRDPSIIYFLESSEIWALISVNRKEEKGNLRHSIDAKMECALINWTDSVYSAVFFSICCNGFCWDQNKEKLREQDIENQFLGFTHTSCSIIELH